MHNAGNRHVVGACLVSIVGFSACIFIGSGHTHRHPHAGRHGERTQLERALVFHRLLYTYFIKPAHLGHCNLVGALPNARRADSSWTGWAHRW
jgi:hypothetical protein